jgi:hypothetical protein
MIEGKWQCSGDDDIAAKNPMSPFTPGRRSLPPYFDYQTASIIIHRVLMPLRAKVLRDLQDLVLEHKAKDWFVIFLVSFILLHNYELQMQFQLSYSTKRKLQVGTSFFRYPFFPFLFRIHPFSSLHQWLIQNDPRVSTQMWNLWEPSIAARKSSSLTFITVVVASGHSEQILIGGPRRLKKWHTWMRNRLNSYNLTATSSSRMVSITPTLAGKGPN